MSFAARSRMHQIVFSSGRELYVYLQAYRSDGPLLSYVTFFRGGVKAYETAPLPVAEVVNPRLKTQPLKFSLALDKLQPGRYTCQITVLDPKESKAAFWQAPLWVIAEPRP